MRIVVVAALGLKICSKLEDNNLLSLFHSSSVRCYD